MNYTNTFFNSLLHLVYPKLCAGCGSDLVTGDHLICLSCMSGLPETNFFMHAGNPVEKIFWGRLKLEAASSHMYFTKGSVMQNLLHQFKYRGRSEVGIYFGNMIGESFINTERFGKVDALVPLPLHFKKEKKRGYNQAAVICDGIAGKMNVPVLKDVIKRRIKTETQTQMNRMERWDNIEGKFELIKSSMIKNKHLLLVDDVITTGATLEACGAELLKGEGVKLSIASLAYTTL
jgi:ComF family protein